MDFDGRTDGIVIPYGGVDPNNVQLFVLDNENGALLVDSTGGRSEASLDLPGVVIGTTAVGLLAYSIVEGPGTGWFHPAVLGAIAGAGLLIPVFALRLEPVKWQWFVDGSATGGLAPFR